MRLTFALKHGTLNMQESIDKEASAMRLRNIPRADGVLTACPLVVKDEASHRGNWASGIFGSPNPIHIEIGMGKGQFLLSLAGKNPHINYIGIERYSSVLLRAVEKIFPQKSLEDPQVPANLRFICMDAAQIESVFSPGEVERIYLNFSDPWPKARHAHRRLTSEKYLTRYDHILSADGQIELKTDNRGLFDFSVQTIRSSSVWDLSACTYDLHQDPAMCAGNIMTEYEEKFSCMQNPICKLIARRQSNVSLYNATGAKSILSL